jgi:pimeloyl-ACP methyl ester carboxylesterase
LSIAFELVRMLHMAATIVILPKRKAPARRETMTTKLPSFTRRSFCGRLAAMVVLPLAAQRGAMAQTHPQHKSRTSILEVPGARLSYETHGSGPVMLMVPGATGSAYSFQRVTEHLAAHYTVVTYDRRGFSRSQLDGRQDYSRRLETDADDVRRLIEHVSDEPATVFGASSGGIIVLEVLIRHPSVVRTLVPHEPAAVKLLSDRQKWVDFFFGVYDLYRQSGMEPALKKFREHAFAESDREVMAHGPRDPNIDPNIGKYLRANAIYWFEHELRQYPAVDLDLDAFTAHADRIVPMAGRESRGYPCYEVNVELAKKLSRDLIELPGGHIGYVTQPAEFARECVQALARTGHGPKP